MIDIAEWALIGLRDDWRCWMVRGGRGSGKSHGIATLIVCLMRKSMIRVLCLREFQNSIDDSSKQLLEDKINALGYTAEFRITKYSITHIKTGSRCIFRGMKSGNSLRSTEGIDLVWGEEAQTFSEASLRSLFPTIRKKGSRLIFTFNPEKETDPIWKRCVRWADDARVIQSVVNWSDNPWFTEELNEERLRDLRTDPAMYAHIWEGELLRRSAALIMLDKCELGLEFDRPAYHETDDGRFYLGGDFGFAADPNVLSFMWIKDGYLWVEYAVFGYGIELEDIERLYDTVPGARDWPILADSARPDIISMLRNRGFNIEGAPKGPGSVEDGITFLRSFRGIKIHRRCEEAAKEAASYSYKVDPKTDQILPIVVDAENHFWDSCIARGQLVTARRGYVPIEDIQIGDEVMTRQGWRPVNGHRLTRKNADILEVQAGSCNLRATPCHLVWTENKGWIRMDALSYNDTLLMDGEYENCLKIVSSMLEENGGFIQTQIMPALGFITEATRLAGKRAVNIFTGGCGKIITGQSQKDTKFITLMAILTITRLRIWNAFPLRSITKSTLQTQKFSRKGLITPELLPTNGTPLRKAMNFTRNLAKCLGKNSSPFLACVSNAKKTSCLKHGLETYFALMLASPRLVGTLASMMFRKHVKAAPSYSRSTSMPKDDFVRANVQRIIYAGKADVFDISVEGCHEFVASGVLVHNCRYATSLLAKSQNGMSFTEEDLAELEMY